MIENSKPAQKTASFFVDKDPVTREQFLSQCDANRKGSKTKDQIIAEYVKDDDPAEKPQMPHPGL
jgi:hypothetical protein